MRARLARAVAPAPALVLAAVLVLAVAVAATGLGCALVQPETGDLVTACIDNDSNPAVAVDFKTQIRPLMNGVAGGPKPCANCHYDDRGTREGLNQVGLNLRTLETLRKGSSAREVVIPGSPCKSPIVQKLKGTFGGARMPKGGPYWSPEQIQLMIDWIAEGAVGEHVD